MFQKPFLIVHAQAEAVTLAETPTAAAAEDADMGWTDAAAGAGDSTLGGDDDDEEAGLAAYADDKSADVPQVGRRELHASCMAAVALGTIELFVGKAMQMPVRLLAASSSVLRG